MVHITALGAFSRASRLPWGDTPAMVWSPFHVQHEGLSAASTRGRPRGGHCRPRRLPIKARTAPHIVGAPGLDRHNRPRPYRNRFWIFNVERPTMLRSFEADNLHFVLCSEPMAVPGSHSSLLSSSTALEFRIL